MSYVTDEITRYDCELDYDDTPESAYATMSSYPNGDFVRYEDYVESHEFVDHKEQVAFQTWFNAECLSENWSQQTRDLYWEVWKAAIKSKEIVCQA